MTDNKYTSTTKEDIEKLLDAGMTSQELADLETEKDYYNYDVTDEMELIRTLNLKFKIRSDYDFGVEDY